MQSNKQGRILETESALAWLSFLIRAADDSPQSLYQWMKTETFDNLQQWRTNNAAKSVEMVVQPGVEEAGRGTGGMTAGSKQSQSENQIRTNILRPG